MKRIFTRLLIATLALVIGISTAATAHSNEGATAQASAKKKGKAKGKKKANCKATKKGKAKKSAAKNRSTAKKKAAAKKRAAAKCKRAKKKRPSRPKTGKTRPASGFADGLYSDAAEAVKVNISGGGAQVEVTFQMAGLVAQLYTFSAAAETRGSTLSASGSESIFGGSGTLTWDLTVSNSLSYQLKVSQTVQFPEQDPITSNDTFRGRLEAG